MKEATYTINAIAPLKPNVNASSKLRADAPRKNQIEVGVNLRPSVLPSIVPSTTYNETPGAKFIH